MDQLHAKFRDRIEAGLKLARKLQHYGGRTDVLALGLPRGGVIVAAEVAQALGVPLDVMTIRKLGVPGHEELAMGAVGPGGIRVVNDEVVRDLAITGREIERVAEKEAVEQRRRERLFRGERAPLDLRGKKVILVDDGLATGSSMRAAISAARGLHASSVVVGVPVAAAASLSIVRREADDVIAVITGEPFFAVGYWYDDFTQTSDAEVQAALERIPVQVPARS